MVFQKRKWYWVLAAFVVLCIGSFVIFKPKAPLEPITIYKATTPTPKPSFPTEPGTEKTSITMQHGPDQGHRQAHPQETAPHTHTAAPPTADDGYDWLDDSAFDATLPQKDPWKQTSAQKVAVEASNSEAAEIYPPRNWYKTEDPVLRAEYYGAQMLKQFGDIPEVRTVSDWERKKTMGRIPTHEELIIYLEALYHLFPREGTLRALNYHRELSTKGVQVKMIPEGDPR